MTDNNELKGLGGWLILVGVGVVLSPIRLLVIYIPYYKSIFEDGRWEAFTTVGSEAYIPYFGAMLIGEITFNSIMVVVLIYLIFLFFSKHHLFPKIFIGIFVASIIFIFLDALLVTMVFPDESIFDPKTTIALMQALIGCLIWVPYMLVSKRVRATFVGKLHNKKMQPTAESVG
ncbi:DUF2569 domain-containing protein [Sediminibacterium sp.]|uniref:DUF2569 domain-containing protein n=1 Tax=Sediminibacterium sp. TaxID=1917865 RepID=UPI00351D780F